jgi:hypothetical protein
VKIRGGELIWQNAIGPHIRSSYTWDQMSISDTRGVFFNKKTREMLADSKSSKWAAFDSTSGILAHWTHQHWAWMATTLRSRNRTGNFWPVYSAHAEARRPGSIQRLAHTLAAAAWSSLSRSYSPHKKKKNNQHTWPPDTLLVPDIVSLSFVAAVSPRSSPELSRFAALYSIAAVSLRSSPKIRFPPVLDPN